MLEKYGGAGLALLEARAKFKVASQYGDDIEIETERHGVPPLELLHAAPRDEGRRCPALEGFEKRGCGPCAIPADRKRLRSAPIPPESARGLRQALRAWRWAARPVWRCER